MKLEITIEGQETIIHKLTKAKSLLGSGAESDIVVQAEGISRKHLVVIVDGDQFFVVDQGSTNGSFINEERLVPGTKASFTSFFPVRLGFHVSLSLLSDDEEPTGQSYSGASAYSSKEPSVKKMGAIKKTSSSKTTSSTKTLKIKKTSSEYVGKSEPTKVLKTTKGLKSRGKAGIDEDKRKMLVSKVLAAFIVIGSFGYYYFESAEIETVAPQVATASIEDAVKVVEEKVKEQSFNELPPEGNDVAIQSATLLKCNTKIEKLFCTSLKLPHRDYPMSGMVMTPQGYVIFLPDIISRDDFFREFSAERNWKFNTQNLIAERLSYRDLISAYFARLKPSSLKVIDDIDYRALMFVGFISKNGQRTGEFLFADTASFLDHLQGPYFGHSLNLTSTMGLEPLDFIGGQFRAIP
jgi:hypothetical protein